MSDITILNRPAVQLIRHSSDGDASIVQAAKVSLLGGIDVPDADKSAGLINYLMREKHGSPFEHNSQTFYVEAPIFVFREFHRHRVGFSYNEMSGRYTQLPPRFYTPDHDRNLRNIGTSSRPEFAPGTEYQQALVDARTLTVYETAWQAYQEMLDAGIANEVARIVLPVGTMSQMYVTANLRAWLNFLSLRTQRADAAHVSRPQREIEMVAEAIEEKLTELFPIAMASFNKNKRVAP